MGCGWRNFGVGWTHIDGGNYTHLDHNDITRLPYKDEEVDLIYCSHVLEYFDRGEAVELLKEWKRVLKQGGTLRVAVPDFAAYVQLYHSKSIGLQECLGPLYGKMKMKDDSIYHKTTYDKSSLQQLLKKAAFKDVKRYDWRLTCHAQFDDHSQAYIPHMDKKNGTLMSLNLEGKK